MYLQAHGPLEFRKPKEYTIPIKRNISLPSVPEVTIVRSLTAAAAVAAAMAAAKTTGTNAAAVDARTGVARESWRFLLPARNQQQQQQRIATQEKAKPKRQPTKPQQRWQLLGSAAGGRAESSASRSMAAEQMDSAATAAGSRAAANAATTALPLSASRRIFSLSLQNQHQETPLLPPSSPPWPVSSLEFFPDAEPLLQLQQQQQQQRRQIYHQQHISSRPSASVISVSACSRGSKARIHQTCSSKCSSYRRSMSLPAGIRLHASAKMRSPATHQRQVLLQLLRQLLQKAQQQRRTAAFAATASFVSRKADCSAHKTNKDRNRDSYAKGCINRSNHSSMKDTSSNNNKSSVQRPPIRGIHR